jgi:N utilization substance protein B
MGTRRRARERAVQFLYQYDLNPAENLLEAMEQFFESQRIAALRDEPAPPTPPAPAPPGTVPPPPTTDEASIRLFAEPLIRGVLQHREAIDAEIQKYAVNWDIRRMAAVDRNILRLAVYEMRHRDDIPPVVSINEAVDIAKRFSTQDSGKFVNGILDRIKGDLMRPARVGTS